MRLRTQLFLLIAVLCLMMAVSASVFFRLSVERGFSRYLEESEPPFLRTLQTQLEIYYGQQRSWSGLVPQWWEFVDRMTAPPGRGPMHDREPPGRMNDGPPPFPDGLDERPEEDDRRPPRLPLFLLDADRSLVAGSERAEPGTLLTPLRVDGELVGWLGLAPRPEDIALRNQSFLDNQLGNVLLITAVLLAIALLVAWRMSRLWLARVEDVMRGMRHFSQGDYRFRSQVSGHDELAQLAGQLNDLGHTLQAGRHARERWMADMSHELRTPLAVLQGQLEALQDGIRPLTPDAIAMLHQQVARLTALVGDLHDLALTDLGALSYHKAPLDMSQWLTQQAQAWQLLAEQSGLAFTADIAAGGRVLADEARLHQLLINLITNSVKYTDAPGVVALTLRQNGSHVIVTLEDSAPAVSDDVLARLFEPLFRDDASRDRKLGGSGLGLSIARRIAEAHDGSLNASLSERGGLMMTLILPCAA